MLNLTKEQEGSQLLSGDGQLADLIHQTTFTQIN